MEPVQVKMSRSLFWGIVKAIVAAQAIIMVVMFVIMFFFCVVCHACVRNAEIKMASPQGRCCVATFNQST